MLILLFRAWIELVPVQEFSVLGAGRPNEPENAFLFLRIGLIPGLLPESGFVLAGST